MTGIKEDTSNKKRMQFKMSIEEHSRLKEEVLSEWGKAHSILGEVGVSGMKCLMCGCLLRSSLFIGPRMKRGSGNRKLSEKRLILPRGSAIMKKDSGASAPEDRKVIVTEDVS